MPDKVTFKMSSDLFLLKKKLPIEKSQKKTENKRPKVRTNKL